MIRKAFGREVVFEQFTLNESLIFALKSISGDTENDIISYFYDLGAKLLSDSVNRKKMPQQCNRVIKTFYKDTQLHVRFEVFARFKHWRYESDNNSGEPIKVLMELTFPNDSKYLKGSDIDSMFTETGLGLNDDQVVIINKPQEKLYKCLKK